MISIGGLCLNIIYFGLRLFMRKTVASNFQKFEKKIYIFKEKKCWGCCNGFAKPTPTVRVIGRIERYTMLHLRLSGEKWKGKRMLNFSA